MELLNATKLKAGYTMGMKPDGRELLVVVAKGTFRLPTDGGIATLAHEQQSLIEADIFSGEPGLSAPLYESDYAPFKPRCDVILNGSAYAPGGRSAKKVTVALRVGPIQKTFDVVGNRYWKKSLMFIDTTPVEPFTVMPISYNNAFGGVDNTHADGKKHQAFSQNPVGVGFHVNLESKAVEGEPLPNTEDSGKGISKPNGKYRAMAFGVVGRSWQPRMSLAGTYDESWLENVFPFLPADFDEAYYLAAPPDQQMAYPKGGEEVVLENLTSQGVTRFRLPRVEVPVEFSLQTYERKQTHAVIDTIVIEPDLQRFSMTWRTSLPLRRNIFEVAQVVVGEMSPAWYRARALGKTYYRSLAALSASRKAEAEDM